MNEREVSKSYWINAKKRINVNRFSLSSNALSASELFNIRTPYRSVYYYYCINQRYYLQHNLAVQLYVHMYIENEHEVHEYDIHSHAHMPNMQYLFVVLKWFLTDCYCDHIIHFCLFACLSWLLVVISPHDHLHYIIIKSINKNASVKCILSVSHGVCTAHRRCYWNLKLLMKMWWQEEWKRRKFKIICERNWISAIWKNIKN